MDRSEQFNIVEDHLNILKEMKELKLYIVEYNKNGTIKLKTYFPDCTIDGENKQLIIMITHDKYSFFANNSLKKA